MTNAHVRPVSAPSSRLTVRTVPSHRPRMAAGKTPTTQQLTGSARRVTDTYPKLLTLAEFDPTTLPTTTTGRAELVLAKSIPVQSQCEHHLLPFHGLGRRPAAGAPGPKSVGMVIEHNICACSLRGVRATGSRTVTSAPHGLLRADARSRQEFFALTGIR